MGENDRKNTRLQEEEKGRQADTEERIIRNLKKQQKTEGGKEEGKMKRKKKNSSRTVARG